MERKSQKRILSEKLFLKIILEKYYGKVLKKEFYKYILNQYEEIFNKFNVSYIVNCLEWQSFIKVSRKVIILTHNHNNILYDFPSIEMLKNELEVIINTSPKEKFIKLEIIMEGKNYLLKVDNNLKVKKNKSEIIITKK